MTSPRTPNYRLKDAVVWQASRNSSQVLEAGSYIRPIETQYVPQHVIDRCKNFHPASEVFVYTRYGIIPVPKSSIEEA